MHKFKHAFFALPLLLLGALAQAQSAGTITFTANKTSATGSLVPVLTWSTSPVATSCVAGGGWSGTKFASGSETLATITSSKSYTLTCSWGNGSASVSWVKPTRNADGSTLTNLAGFKVVFGNSASSLSQSKAVNNASATSTSIAALASGTWYFAVRAVNSNGVESANSAVASKTISSASAVKTVNITISGSSSPPPSGSSEVEPNNTRSQAQTVSSSGTTINGTMSASSDQDYYKISLPAGKRLSATMTPNSSSDYELYLLNSNDTAVAWSESGKGIAETVGITNSGSSTATWYVRVHYFAGGTGSTNGKYGIRFSW
jgi:serine protease